MPVQPRSAICAHMAGSNPVVDSANVRTADDGDLSSRRRRAEARRASCSAVKIWAAVDFGGAVSVVTSRSPRTWASARCLSRLLGLQYHRRYAARSAAPALDLHGATGR